MITNSTVCRMFLVTALLMAACGPSRSKNPKKTTNNDVNNTTSNNTVANNTTVNNTTVNNTTVNNTTVNNTTANNELPCVGVSPASINFGEVQIPGTGQASVTVQNCSSSQPLTINGATAPEGFDVLLPASVELAPQTTAEVMVEFTPTGPSGFVGDVTIETNAGAAIITVQGLGIESIEPDCPISVAEGRATPNAPWTTNVVAALGTSVEFTARNSAANEAITRYEWVVVSRPAGSTARLMPSATVSDPTLLIDAEGTYTVDLRAFTATSPDTCPAARMEVSTSVTDPNGVSVQLVWDTPSDPNQTDSDGTDMDLHYMHPMGVWNMQPYDCYWLNLMADWGVDGIATVDLDDVDGAGPENISHANPSAMIYRVGVHYFADKGFGASTATVRVSRGGVQIAERTKELSVTADFWFVGSLDANTDMFTPDDTVTSGFPNP